LRDPAEGAADRGERDRGLTDCGLQLRRAHESTPAVAATARGLSRAPGPEADPQAPQPSVGAVWGRIPAAYPPAGSQARCRGGSLPHTRQPGLRRAGEGWHGRARARPGRSHPAPRSGRRISPAGFGSNHGARADRSCRRPDGGVFGCHGAGPELDHGSLVAGAHDKEHHPPSSKSLDNSIVRVLLSACDQAGRRETSGEEW
jgi:hypothetical protein